MDIRIAHVVQTLANINRDPKKHPQGFPLTDFILPFGDLPNKVKQKQTWQQQFAIAQIVAGALTAAAETEVKRGKFE